MLAFVIFIKLCLVVGALYFFICSLSFLASGFRLVAGLSGITDLVRDDTVRARVLGIGEGFLTEPWWCRTLVLSAERTARRDGIVRVGVAVREVAANNFVQLVPLALDLRILLEQHLHLGDRVRARRTAREQRVDLHVAVAARCIRLPAVAVLLARHRQRRAVGRLQAHALAARVDDALKTNYAEEAYNPDGLVPRAVRMRRGMLPSCWGG